MKARAFYVALNVNLITKTWIVGTEDKRTWLVSTPYSYLHNQSWRNK
jgi:hypothetical protein